ncbi:MAG: hypothetical protein HC836_12600 [Richelia sp. RM2_1_2]|nr:hypothetical protein [Richelia sp. RM2_1_2]
MYQFDNVSFLSYNHTPDFFEAGLRYRISKNFTIRGQLLNLTNGDGISGILSKQNLLIDSNDWQPIILNGVNFGTGKISNINFTEGNLVRQQEYVFDITCYEEGNLSNALTGVYSGIDWSNVFKIDTLNESFSYTQEDNGRKNYEQTFSCRFHSGLVLDVRQAAIDFINVLIDANNLLNFIGNYNFTKDKKSYNSITYNNITNQIDLTRSIEILSNESGYYSFEFQHNIETSEDGITTASEEGEIKGLIEPIYEAASSGYNDQVAIAFSRLNNTFSSYVSNAYSLNPLCLENGKTTNEREGVITYRLTYDNDPRTNDLYFHEYTLDISQSQENITNVSENGTVQGIGRSFIDKFSNAVYGYNQISGDIYPRILNYYTENTNITKPISKIGQSLERNEIEGSIGYSEQYTDDNTFVNESGIKKFDINIQTAYPVHFINKFNVFNTKEFVQKSNQSTIGNRAINISLLGRRNLSFDEYLNYAKAKAKPHLIITGGADGYIEGVNCDFNIEDNTFTFNLSALFHEYYKPISEITLT